MAKLSVEKAILKAKSYAKRGEFEEATKLYEAVLKSFPNNKRAQKGLTNLKYSKELPEVQNPPKELIDQLVSLYNQGQLEKVAEQATFLTQKYPRAFFIWNLLGVANNGLNKVSDAASAFKRVTELNPLYADGFNNFGATLKAQRKFKEAKAAFERAIELKPNYAEAYNNIGLIYKEQSVPEQALAMFEKALMIKPQYADAYTNIGIVLAGQGKMEEAIDAYNKAIKLNPNSAETYYNLANALRTKGDFSSIINAYHKVISLKPDFAEAYNNLGATFQDFGKQDDAILAYRSALNIRKNYAEVHRHLSLLVKYSHDDPQIHEVSELVSRSDISLADKCHLLYAYAKINEDLGELESAFTNYLEGGEIRKKLLNYQKDNDEKLFAKIKSNQPRISRLKTDYAAQSEMHCPIFVVGMLRSGTTLVEQIISCHSLVNGAGELDFLPRHGHALSIGDVHASEQKLQILRNSYLGDLKKFSKGKKFVVDKFPQNFLRIGLIVKAFPEAKIIHVKRDAAATCWSNFKTYFDASGLGYTNNIEDIVHYYRLYSDMMDFWEKLYGNKIFHVNYEELTCNPEFEIRRLIENLGLKWEDECLKPQNNQRSVQTASQEQVRKEIYSGSSNNWRKFEPFLKGAFDEFSLPNKNNL